MNAPHDGQRELLYRIARRVLKERGLEPDFPKAVIAEVDRIDPSRASGPKDVPDLRELPWCSIDNPESRDLDQLTVAADGKGGATRILVAVADVSALVEPGSAIDGHAGANTTSIYTPPAVFPMLPERLSTDLTSLGPDEDRLAVVIQFEVRPDGTQGESSVSRARVRNYAKLAYPSVGAWLEGEGQIPEAAAKVPRLEENLRRQDAAAQALKQCRHERGALQLETVELRAEFDDGTMTGLKSERHNRAKEIIEDFMIAANGAIAEYLVGRRFPVMRRVVRSPERWQRIVDIASGYGDTLPPAPDARALNEFLLRRRKADPLRFPDLSLTIIKLLGRGEYVASFPGQPIAGHFGLAVTDYTHSTAPNRRYPDLLTQRLLHAAFEGKDPPYRPDQLVALATHCTEKEDAVQKAERQVRKSAAALWIADQVGHEFDGVVTGASEKGTWVRVFDPPVEGRVEQGAAGLDVGDRVTVKLTGTDVERGFIDFARVGKPRS